MAHLWQQMTGYPSRAVSNWGPWIKYGVRVGWFLGNSSGEDAPDRVDHLFQRLWVFFPKISRHSPWPSGELFQVTACLSFKKLPIYWVGESMVVG